MKTIAVSMIADGAIVLVLVLVGYAGYRMGNNDIQVTVAATATPLSSSTPTPTRTAIPVNTPIQTPIATLSVWSFPTSNMFVDFGDIWGFVKTNPSKYTLSVEGTRYPYALGEFHEGFGFNWHMEERMTDLQVKTIFDVATSLMSLSLPEQYWQDALEWVTGLVASVQMEPIERTYGPVTIVVSGWINANPPIITHHVLSFRLAE